MRRRFVLGLGTAFVAASLFAGTAQAKIASVDTSCDNPAGHQPGGQQPSCNNDTLTQHSENQNPAGHAPRGQN